LLHALLDSLDRFGLVMSLGTASVIIRLWVPIGPVGAAKRAVHNQCSTQAGVHANSLRACLRHGGSSSQLLQIGTASESERRSQLWIFAMQLGKLPPELLSLSANDQCVNIRIASYAFVQIWSSIAASRSAHRLSFLTIFEV